jgi:hypothetical protein
MLSVNVLAVSWVEIHLDIVARGCWEHARGSADGMAVRVCPLLLLLLLFFLGLAE